VITQYQTFLILFRFQWVTCQLRELQKCTTPRAVRDVVASMPRSLDDTYERMLLNIPDIYARDAFRVFQWMVYSARPLMVEEISEILAFDPDQNPPLDAQRRLFDPKQLLSILSNLATLSTIPGWQVGWYRSQTIEVVTFSHYSVQEYLCSERIVTGRVCRFSVRQTPATYSIAKSCLMYILQLIRLTLGHLKHTICILWRVTQPLTGQNMPDNTNKTNRVNAIFSLLSNRYLTMATTHS
jgi:hypothetical protein